MKRAVALCTTRFALLPPAPRARWDEFESPPGFVRPRGSRDPDLATLECI